MGYKEVHFCTTPFVNIRSSSTYIISIKVLNFPLKSDLSFTHYLYYPHSNSWGVHAKS